MIYIRNIAVVTGSRAEWGYVKPIILELMNRIDTNPQIVVTGMHLSEKYGMTVNEIPYNIYTKVKCIEGNGDTPYHTAKYASNCLDGMIETFKKMKPDIILVSGDRPEMLMAATAGVYMNIPVAHIQGGEISGHVDGVVRHAITKLAHLHLVSNRDAYQRLLGLGEEGFRIHISGAPHVDRLHTYIYSRKSILHKYKLSDDRPLALAVLHPVHNEHKKSAEYMKNMLRAIDLGVNIVLLYPNSDLGSTDMIKEIESFKCEEMKKFKSIPRDDYIALMKHCDVLVGNSCSGIQEAPTFGTPVVNIGTRQKGRFRGENIIDTSNDENDIRDAVIEAIFNPIYDKTQIGTDNPYGDGKASERIAESLATVKLNNPLFKEKVMTY